VRQEFAIKITGKISSPSGRLQKIYKLRRARVLIFITAFLSSLT